MSSSGEENGTANIITGTVKWFNVKSGYGFITRNDCSEDIFVHQTAIIKNNPQKYLRSVGDGESVEFIVIMGTKGPEAAQVTGPNGNPVQGSKYAPDRRPKGGRRYFRRRGPRPAQPRQTQQDSQGEDKTEGTEGEGEGEQVDRRRPRGPPRRFRRYRRGPPRNEDQEEGGDREEGGDHLPSRRRNYRPRNEEQGEGGDGGDRPPPRRRNYRPRNDGPRNDGPRNDGPRNDGPRNDEQGEDGGGERPPRRNYRPRNEEQGEGGDDRPPRRKNYRSRVYRRRPNDGQGDDEQQQSRERPPRRYQRRDRRRPQQGEGRDGREGNNVKIEDAGEEHREKEVHPPHSTDNPEQ